MPSNDMDSIMESFDKLVDLLGAKKGDAPLAPELPPFYKTPNKHRGKKVGAPYGNTNALKHGIYSRLFPRSYLATIQRAGEAKDLSQEIAFLRMQFAILARAMAHKNSPYILPLLTSVSSALARLVSVNNSLQRSSRSAMRFDATIIQQQSLIDPQVNLPDNPRTASINSSSDQPALQERCLPDPDRLPSPRPRRPRRLPAPLPSEPPAASAPADPPEDANHS